ncbi:MAG TPA: tRNA (N6-isopentenyl adenosine(37)-C2)-methylthiotransferase MiaB [Firmicutes bacterium]|nr:tRNA (N6-isopentenyl adenosine(37)-C2)-methylthiotransferase MiaB [Bacillota bacterium]
MLVLAGCVMGEEGVGESLLKTYPFISLIIGTHEVSKLPFLLSEVLKNRQTLVSSSSFSSEVVENMPSLRLSSFEAYVNISYGCDKFCTYCIVPYTRGRERSRQMSDVLKECQDLVESGYKQITLLGQNVNSYGLDLKDGTNFATLLDKVASLGIPRLKFLTSYPSQFTDEMIAVMAKHKNIDPWLHLPVQSGSSSCLKRMGRRYTREEYLSLVKRIREKIPDIALTTDIIVGFPGETEEEFEDTISLMKEVRYASAYTFIYSPRIGTPAARMVQVPHEITQKRFLRLKEVVDDLTKESSDKMLGKTVEVLVEGVSKKNPNKLSGYSRNGKLIHFEGPSYLTGCLVPIKVLSSKTYSLHGELVGDPLLLKAKDLAYLMSVDPFLGAFKNLGDVLSKDSELQSLGEKYIELKKKTALSMGKGKEYEEAKKTLLSYQDAIKSHPLLENYRSMEKEAREELSEIAEILR